MAPDDAAASASAGAEDMAGAGDLPRAREAASFITGAVIPVDGGIATTK